MASDLLAEVRAVHTKEHWCVGVIKSGRHSNGYFPREGECDAARLAALLTPERVTQALVAVEEQNLNLDCLSDACGHDDSDPAHDVGGYVGCGDAETLLVALTSEVRDA